MDDLFWIICGAIVVLVLAAAGVGMWRVHEKTVACEAKGGVLVKSSKDWACVKAQSVL